MPIIMKKPDHVSPEMWNAAIAEVETSLNEYQVKLTADIIKALGPKRNSEVDMRPAKSEHGLSPSPKSKQGVDVASPSASQKRPNYRKLAFTHYQQFGQIVCAHCGFGIFEVLEVAHLDGDRSHNNVANLAILCPTCHKMHDLDLITTDAILKIRDRPRVVLWSKRMKDAGSKAAETRRQGALKRKKQEAGKKAAITRKLTAPKQSGSK